MQGLGTLVPASYNAEDNTIEVVFATEIEVMRRTWEETYREVLVCQSANVRLARLNSGGPVVDSHNTYSIKSQFGRVVRAWIDDATREAKATLKLSQRDEWKGVVQDIVAGIISNISVQYNIYAFDVDDSNPNVPPMYRAIDWEPTEISFVTVPADYNSGSRSEYKEENTVTINFIMKRTNKEIAEIFAAARAAGLTSEYADALANGELSTADALAEINSKRSAPPPAPSPAPVNVAEVRAEERARIAGIRHAAKVVGLDEAFVTGLIDGSVSLDNARAQIIDEAARLNPVTPRLQTGITVGADAKDKKVRGMEASIMQRAGKVSAEVAGDPGEFRGMTLMDLAKECLTEAGVNHRGMSQRQIAVRALSMVSRDGGGGLASGDFSYILQNVLNKTLRANYALQAKTFTPWTRKSSSSDFKSILRTALADIKLDKVDDEVKEGGEYTYAATSDSGESYKLKKYGKIININWEAVINDDLDAFGRIPVFLSGAVAGLQSDLVYDIITGNPVMADGKTLFHAGHGNYTSSGTDINVDSLGIGRKALRLQKSPGGNILNLMPKFLVCGPNKEQVALQYLSANYTATKNGDINPWAGSVMPIVEGRIADNSWHLIADPSLIDTVETCTLDGEDIYTESRYGFEVDAFQWKLRTVFAAKAIEYRGMYKNVGA